MFKTTMTALAVSLAFSANVSADNDFGLKVEKLLNAKSEKYFGFKKPLTDSASSSVIREDGQNAYDLVSVAKGLKAKILTRQAANKADMFAFWPNEEVPSHLVFCIEGGTEDLGRTLPETGIAKLNPSIQTINIKTGAVKTVLRGMNRCDGIRTTAWGTILATEEAGDGQAYELIDLLHISNHTVTNRATGSIIDASGVTSTTVVKRASLPTMSWEGLTVTSDGVVIAGDELRPGDAGDNRDGGALFKFVPETPHTGGLISNLSDSPLVSGNTYALQVQCKSGGNRGFGQGCDAVLLRATDALKSYKPANGVASAIEARREETNYNKFLSFNNLIERDIGKRGEADKQTYLSGYNRRKDFLTGFIGGKCRECGTVQIPREKYCVNPECNALESQDEYSFADKAGQVMTWTADRLTFDWSPPAYFGMVQFEGGGKLMMDFTEVEEGRIDSGSKVSVHFRIRQFDSQRGYRKYFWKAVVEE